MAVSKTMVLRPDDAEMFEDALVNVGHLSYGLGRAIFLGESFALDPQTLTLKPLQGLFKRFLQTTFWGPILIFEGVVKMGYVSLDRKTYLEH